MAKVRMRQTKLGQASGFLERLSRSQSIPANQAPSMSKTLWNEVKSTGILSNIIRSIPIVGSVLDIAGGRDVMRALGNANPFLGMLFGAALFKKQVQDAHTKHAKKYAKYRRNERRIKLLEKYVAGVGGNAINVVKLLSNAEQNPSKPNSVALMPRGTKIHDRVFKGSNSDFQKIVKQTVALKGNINNVINLKSALAKNPNMNIDETLKNQMKIVSQRRREINASLGYTRIYLDRVVRLPKTVGVPTSVRPVVANRQFLQNPTDAFTYAQYLKNQSVFKKKKFARGGMVDGPGTKTSDSIPAMLSKGEYVINADAVKAIGKNTLDAINAQAKVAPIKKMAAGGPAVGSATTVGNIDPLQDILNQINDEIGMTREEIEEARKKKEAEEARLQAEKIKRQEEEDEKYREQMDIFDKMYAALEKFAQPKEEEEEGFSFMKVLRNLTRYMLPLANIVKMVGKTFTKVFIPVYAVWELFSNMYEGWQQGGIVGLVAGIFEGLGEFALGVVELPAMLLDMLFGTDISGWLDDIVRPFVENIGENLTALFNKILDIPRLLIDGFEIVMDIPRMLVAALVDMIPEKFRWMLPDAVLEYIKPTPDNESTESSPNTVGKGRRAKNTGVPVVAMETTVPQTSVLPNSQRQLDANRTIPSNAPATNVNTTVVNNTTGDSSRGTQSAPVNAVRTQDSTMSDLNRQAFSGAFR